MSVLDQLKSALQARVDGWKNIVTGHGTSSDKRTAGRFQGGYHACLSIHDIRAMWEDDYLSARVIERPVKEAFRRGFQFKVQHAPDGYDATQLTSAVHTYWRDVAVPAVKQSCFYARAYGGSGVFAAVNDARTMDKPLNPDSINRIQTLTALEPDELVPDFWQNDPAQPGYGDPSSYRLQPHTFGVAFNGESPGAASLGTSIHASRVIAIQGIRVSRFDTRSSSGHWGWGKSYLQRVHDAIRDFETSMGSAGVLAADFAQGILKLKDLDKLMACPDDAENLLALRLRCIEQGRSTVRSVVIDSEEDYRRQATPLASFPELLDRLAIRVAAAAEIPVTILFGQAPSGLQATGEGDRINFYDSVDDYRQDVVIPAMRQATALVLHSLGAPKGLEWEVYAPPLKQPSDGEIADARLKDAQRASILIGSQVVTPEEVAISMFGGEYSSEIVLDMEQRAADALLGEEDEDDENLVGEDLDDAEADEEDPTAD